MVHYVKTNHLTKQYVEFELIFIFIKYIERREGRGEGEEEEEDREAGRERERASE